MCSWSCCKRLRGSGSGPGQGEFELGLPAEAGGPLPILASRMSHLWGALGRAFDVLGFGKATGGDEVFRSLVAARIIEPTSKLDAARVLAETGVEGLCSVDGSQKAVRVAR